MIKADHQNKEHTIVDNKIRTFDRGQSDPINI